MRLGEIGETGEIEIEIEIIAIPALGDVVYDVRMFECLSFVDRNSEILSFFE